MERKKISKPWKITLIFSLVFAVFCGLFFFASWILAASNMGVPHIWLDASIALTSILSLAFVSLSLHNDAAGSNRSSYSNFR